MARPVTLFTGQWADLPLEELGKKAASWGYDGVEPACWGDHFEVDKALADDSYCKDKRKLLDKLGLKVFAISTHLVGQAVCDNIDERHKSILPPDVWGDGDPEGVRTRAAKGVINAAKAAKKLGVDVVNGFTGSSIWPAHSRFFDNGGILPPRDHYPDKCAVSTEQLGKSKGRYCTARTKDRGGNFSHCSGVPKPCATRGLPGGDNAVRPQVLVSYASEDEAWKDQMLAPLRVFERQGILSIWDDSRINAGADWYQAIETGIGGCSAAILMVSSRYLSSDFIAGEEVPRLLQRRQQEGLPIFPVIVSPCPWKEVEWLSRMQLRPKNGRTISSGNMHEIKEDFTLIAEEVARVVLKQKGVNAGEGQALNIGVSQSRADANELEVHKALADLYRAVNKCHISSGGSGLAFRIEINVTVN
jgi:hypothetical protein